MRALLSVLIFSLIISPAFAQVGPGGLTPRSIYDVSDGSSVNCSPYEIEVSPTTLSCSKGVAVITTGGGGGSSLTITDGVHTVNSVGQITVSGATVGGVSPNATLTITGGGGIPYPSGSGIPLVVSGASWGTTLAEVDGDIIYGVSGAWTVQAPPTWNQNTTGAAASLSISGQTGLLSFAGLTSTNRIITVRDAADTMLELGGSYTPTGTWTSMALTTPTVTTSITTSSANIVTDTTTGTKIATSASQKLGFFNATPIVQPTGDICTAMTSLGLVASCTESGGGGSPGGTNTQVQYNNSSSFGGITNATSDGTTLTLTSPKIVTQINDTNGNTLMGITATGSAVNYITWADAATLNNPTLTANGSDSNIGLGLTMKGTGQVVVSGSTSNPQMTLGSQTLLSSPVAGGIEYDGNNPYFTPSGGSARGGIPAIQYMALTSSNTMASSSAQAIFNVGTSTNGTVAVQSSTTYYFTMVLYITSMSGTTGTASTNFATSGTIGSIHYQAISNHSIAVDGTPDAANIVDVNSASAEVVIATATTTTAQLQETGIIRVTTGGTLTPEISFSHSSTPVIAANSYFEIYPIGTNTTTATEPGVV